MKERDISMAETSRKIVDINIDNIEKTQFRINGRDDAIIELNLSDMGIFERLQNGYEQLEAFSKEAASVEVDDKDLHKKIKMIDEKMREVVDYIFDTNVSDACCKYGTMLDPQDGVYRFETIIDKLTSLYSNNINEEYKKMKNRVNEVAKQYIPQDHKKKQQKPKAEIVKKDDDE